MNSKPFGKGVSRFVENTAKRIDNKIVTITSLLFKAVIDYTPISEPGSGHSGRLVNNWNTALNSYSFVKTERTAPSRVGPTRRMKAIVKAGVWYKKDSWVSLTNAQHYAYRAEYLGWPEPQWSGRVGPYRMVGRAMQEITAMSKANVLTINL